jgi:molybdopterin-guanine dinucleotide biosynthesis protein A
MSVTGVLLAGGASRRFPPNKLLETYEGEPLFWRPLRALDAVCDELVVVLRPDGSDPALPPTRHAAVITRDAVLDQGPLIGLAAGLEAARGDWALVAGGDMPKLRSALLRQIAERAERSDADAIALVAEGRPWPMPAAFRVATARSAIARLVAGGERRLRASFDVLDVEGLDAGWWGKSDPRADWRADIDRPSDLD